MLYTYEIETKDENFYDITHTVRETIIKSQVENGICLVYTPHTTAAITVNENADPDVVKDMLWALKQSFPNRREFRHQEGNSSAHCKASCLACNQSFIIDQGHILLGTWQGIYFCEFDPPRKRKFYVKIIAG